MAGMLPGVEAARRRRVHQTSSNNIIPTTSPPTTLSRRLSFSLFSNSTPSSFIQERRRAHLQADEKLGRVAREAKGRLDERLRAQRKQPPFVARSDGNSNSNNERSEAAGPGVLRVNIKELKREVYGSKKSSGGGSTKKLMGWSNKLGWKAGEQQECAVCLDEFKVGDTMFNLRCAHRFHDNCLRPWLHSNSHCPCCRLFIVS